MTQIVQIGLTTVATVIGAVVISSNLAQAATINLDFSTLPTAQGWNYYGIPNYIAESSVFSVDGTTLFQNTMGTGLYSQGSNYYRLPNVIDPTLPFSLEVRARVLAEETNVSYPNSFGFFFGANSSAGALGIALSPQRIQFADFTVINTTIDNRDFHTYLLKANPGNGFQLFVDGGLIYTGNLLQGAYANQLLLGDGTGGTNANVEVTLFRFTQGQSTTEQVPEPMGVLGIAAGTSFALAKRHQKLKTKADRILE